MEENCYLRPKTEEHIKRNVPTKKIRDFGANTFLSSCAGWIYSKAELDNGFGDNSEFSFAYFL